MHEMVQGVIHWYVGLLGQYGLGAVALLMALESTVVPIPSELIIPPAAYWAKDAWFMAAMVIVAGTVGSLVGATASYWLARWIGRPLLLKYGKYVHLTPKKLQHAEEWVIRYGAMGIFLARLIPGIRHINPIPAGLAGMRFRTFFIMTAVGSALWCAVLTVFGLIMAHDMAVFMNSGGNTESEGFKQAFANLTWGTCALLGLIGLLYLVGARLKHRAHRHETPTPTEARGAR